MADDEALVGTVVCGRESHERFAQAYAVHGNAVAAYKRTYPEASPESVDANAHRVANHPDVRRRVAELQEARRKRLMDEAADLEALVANLAVGGQAAKLVDEGGNPIPLRELPIEVQRALKGVKFRISTLRDGTVVRSIDYDLPDPLQALRLLAQLRGALVERSDITSGGRPLPTPVDPRDLPALDRELRQRLLPPPAEDGSDLV
jgi:hypothetical protein